uniref:Uncharacterized protein n=1 Tax=Pavo cristatus TaxID=9049 RepID=A0A8C9FTM0_PAVCR
VVSGVAALRELLVSRGEEFTTRGHFAIGEKQSAELGLFMSNGAAWSRVRRFTLTALRDAGMGGRGAEEMAMEEARVQEELDRVVGPERLPSLRDRPALPYTDAVIHEVQRHQDLIPLGFVRTVTRDTPFRGYLIPRVTIYPLLSSALKDPHHFPDPERFDPQHFLDSEGKLRRCDAFLPFSAGRRMCLGEPLARTQLFVFTAALLRRFRLRPPPGEEPPPLRPDIGGITNIPPPLRLRFCPR